MGKLVLSRRVGERVAIDETTFVSVERIRGDHVRLGFEAPRRVRIVRDELDRTDDAKPFEPYQQRVVDEKVELDGKHRKLIEFIEESPTFPRLPEDGTEPIAATKRLHEGLQRCSRRTYFGIHLAGLLCVKG